MMAPALLLANFSPVGPAVMIALLGVITIYLVWYMARIWFGKTAGLIAAFFYAISPTIIVFAKSSWNPNIMPFFSLVIIFSLWKIWEEQKFKWLIVLGIAYAFVLQSHYLGLLLAPVILIFWLLTLVRIRKQETRNRKEEIRPFLKFSLISLFLFAFLMSPLVIFDARHGWNNFSAMKKFFSERQTTVSIKPWNAIPRIWPIFEKINTKILTAGDITLGKIVSIFFVLAALYYWLNRKNVLPIIRSSLFLILIWFGFALLGLGLYKQEIYDHYYGFFFAVPFFLLGAYVKILTDKKKNGKGLFFLLLGVLAFFNFRGSPLKSNPNMQLQRSINVSKFIEEKANGNIFNFAVIAERNYEGAYQYFLEKDNASFVMIERIRGFNSAHSISATASDEKS